MARRLVALIMAALLSGGVLAQNDSHTVTLEVDCTSSIAISPDGELNFGTGTVLPNSTTTNSTFSLAYTVCQPSEIVVEINAPFPTGIEITAEATGMMGRGDSAGVMPLRPFQQLFIRDIANSGEDSFPSGGSAVLEYILTLDQDIGTELPVTLTRTVTYTLLDAGALSGEVM